MADSDSVYLFMDFQRCSLAVEGGMRIPAARRSSFLALIWQMH